MTKAILRTWTIWRFRGVTIPCENVVARPSEPREVSHEYQTVLGRVEAYTAEGAIKEWRASRCGT